MRLEPRNAAVLFTVLGDERPTSSLLRAVAIAHVLDADLHVFRVLPPTSRVNALFPQHNVVDAVYAVEQTLHAHRATKEWLSACLPDGDPAIDDFVIAHGDFIARVAQQAAELQPALIVVPSRKGETGNGVTALARASGVPVLVAREATKEGTIVAATDLEWKGYPVLSRAATLGAQLDAPVVAIHNLKPATTSLGNEKGALVPLQAAAGTLPVDTRAVVRSEVNAVDAILEEARVHNADMVVVGTRERTWFARFFRGNVAAQVVNRAKRSVLVVPLGAKMAEVAAG